MAPVALRIKLVELNRSPLWGLYQVLLAARARARAAVRC
jgi:hypothetical protein